ncbi:MAG: hypothetical protein ACXVKO_02285 [Bacteriovorax sp.]
MNSFASLSSPNISANALMLYKNSNLGNQPASTNVNGLSLEEAELNFYSDVDPYTHLNMVFTIHPELSVNSTTHQVSEETKFEAEEVYADSTIIPNLTLKLGKFKSAFGKHATLHTHVFPLIDAPLVNHVLIGDDGLADLGASSSFLLPAPWFLELTTQYLRGKGDNFEFNSPYPNNPVGVFHLKNLFDLNEATTLEVGGSYATGKNSLNDTTKLKGADLTIKWRPLEGGRYTSFIVGSEYIARNLGQGEGFTAEKGKGYNVWGKYQFAERWDVVYRYDHLKVEGSDSTVNLNALANNSSYKHAVGVDFNASEFSSFHLEYNWMKGIAQDTNRNNEKVLFLQANFTIGSHPAHTY